MPSKLKRIACTYVLYHMAHLPAQVITYYFVSKLGSWVELNPIMHKILEVSPVFAFIVPVPVILFLSVLANYFDRYRRLLVTVTLFMLLINSVHDTIALMIYLLQKNV